MLAAKPSLAADNVVWRTGPDLLKQLEKPLGPAGLAWAGQPLRDAVRNLSRGEGIRVAMLLDRRIDPEQRLTLTLGDMPLDEALSRIARQAHGEQCQIGSVIYIGPSSITRRLRTVAELRKEEIRKLPADVAKRLLQSKSLRWDDLAEPRTLLESLSADAGFTIDNLSDIPHDLWSAADLPSMTVAERITIVAGGFDMTFAIDAAQNRLHLVPIPERVAVTRMHTVGANVDDIAAKLAERFTDCKITTNGKRMQVVGSVEDQIRIDRLLAGKPVKAPPAAAQVNLDRLRIDSFTAKNQPIGALIKAVARRIEYEVEFDPGIGKAKIKLDQLVSIELKSGTIRELLTKITAPYGLEYEVQENKLLVRPAMPK